MYLFSILSLPPLSPLFFFNDTATPEIYTLSLHDALPISLQSRSAHARCSRAAAQTTECAPPSHCAVDQKSTRLNSSHLVISYAVFCLKKKKEDSRSSTAVSV